MTSSENSGPGAPSAKPSGAPKIGIIMGSQSDWPTMRHTAEVLDALEVPYEARIVSAHRTPDRLVDYAKTAKGRGLRVIVAGAGGAAHLPGMAAAMTPLPVLGVPVESRTLKGQDSLLSIVQMPGGVPVGTLAIGKAGAINAGLMGAAILALKRSRACGASGRVAPAPDRGRGRSARGHPGMSAAPKAPLPPGPLPPGSVIGMLGGGQLGRMTALAAARLGYHTHVLCPEPDSPTAKVTDRSTLSSYTDFAALDRFAAAVDVVTYEFENIPIACVRHLAERVAVHPGPKALAICQDRLAEKRFVTDLGIGCAPFRPISCAEELHMRAEELGLPSVLKTARMGYDGKGQAMLKAPSALDTAWATVGAKADKGGEAPCILEGFVDFAFEASVIAARGADGSVVCYDPAHNVHRDHILHTSTVPAPLTQAQTGEAISIATALVEGMDLIGLLAVELFVTKSGALLVNEMAPRPHNSGHWTMEGAPTSQFEQLVRAVTGLPLGPTDRYGDAVMTNLIGEEAHDWPSLLAEPGAHLHLYGKAEARSGRKMGHVTRLKRS